MFVLLVIILLFSVLTSIPYDHFSVYQCVGKVLKCTVATAHKWDVGESPQWGTADAEIKGSSVENPTPPLTGPKPG